MFNSQFHRREEIKWDLLYVGGEVVSVARLYSIFVASFKPTGKYIFWVEIHSPNWVYGFSQEKQVTMNCIFWDILQKLIIKLWI